MLDLTLLADFELSFMYLQILLDYDLGPLGMLAGDDRSWKATTSEGHRSPNPGLNGSLQNKAINGC